MREEIDSLTNEECEKFIEECQGKLDRKGEEETLFSIVGGKSTDERTASRILAFFFDTNREHKMKDFFIKSFIEAAGEYYEDFPHEFTVEKEFYTKHGKKIDILLLNPQRNIVIENKIYADLYNDLKEYYDTAKSKKCGSPKEVKGYVLSLFDVQDSIDEKKVGDNFKCVTYEKFLDALEQNEKDYNISTNLKYSVLYQDFKDNMRLLEEKNMDKIDTSFWNRYKELYQELEEQRVEILKGKADALKSTLVRNFKKDPKFETITTEDIHIWNRDKLINTDCKEENAYQVSVWFNYKSKKNNCTIQPNIIISLLEGTRIFIIIKLHILFIRIIL